MAYPTQVFTDIDAINRSGTPLTGGSSASAVNNTAVYPGSFSVMEQEMMDKYMDLVQKNTEANNAWSAEQAQKQMDFQKLSNQLAMDFNASEAAKNRDWQEMMSNTAHQREIRDLQAAGLNPVLSASGGNGAAVTSGSAASGMSSSGAKGDTDTSSNTVLASLYGAMLNAQTSMRNATVSAQTNLRIAQMQQEAQLAAAEIARQSAAAAAGTQAAASMYASDQNLLNNREQRDWNASHPSSAISGLNALIGALTGSDDNSGISSGKGLFNWFKKNLFKR